MKILIVDTYYSAFLDSFWKKNSNLRFSPYEVQLKTLLDQCFGTGDFYSFNFKKIGIEAIDVVANDEILQTQWAREHNLSVSKKSLLSPLQKRPFLHKFFGRPKWLQEIVLAQIEKVNPDVLYFQELTALDADYLAKAKQKVKLLVGQIASPRPSSSIVQSFDLIVTSFPHFVGKFRSRGIRSEYLPLGFESRILERVKTKKKVYDLVFIGSFSPYHMKSIKLLEGLASKIPMDVWGSGLQFLSPFSPLRKKYHGEAWGIDMYTILAQSKIVVNRHISTAEDNANNMRLYESTGMGAMLLTDEKKNLNELFRIGKEVISYNSSEDLVRKTLYFLSHDKEREKIALSGQTRTLESHTYVDRMKNLKKILERNL